MTAKDRAGGDLFMDLAAEYPGQPLIMTNALRDQIMVADPSVLPEILVHRCYDFTKPTKSAAFLRRILGEGLVVAEGDHHRVLRKHSMPAFNFRHIKDLYPMMWDKAELLTRILGGEVAAGAAIELGTWANKITLDIIGVAGMGRDINAAQKASDPIQSAYEKLLEPSREAMLYGMAYFLLGPRVVRWLPWRMNRVFDETGDRLDAICQQLIRDKRSAIVDKEDSHFDVLSLLIKTNKFSDPVLKDQLLTFLAAGYVSLLPHTHTLPLSTRSMSLVKKTDL